MTRAARRAFGTLFTKSWPESLPLEPQCLTRRAIGRDPAKSNNARRTFHRPEIQERIEYLRGEFNYQAGISLAALQARLLRIADANVVDFFEADATDRKSVV